MIRRALLPIAAAVLVAACGAPPEETPAVVRDTRSSSLQGAFEAAAAEYQVPVEVLKAVAYVETGMLHQVQPSAMGGHGVMHLVEREDWNTLRRAAELTGVDPGRLKLDPASNIRGAAAVLRELADRSFRDYADLNPADPADFWHAVMLYGGLSQANLAREYAREVYLTVERGFESAQPDGVVSLAPKLLTWRRHLPALQARQDFVKEYPGAYAWRPTNKYIAGRDSYTDIVIHTTQGAYPGALDWLLNPAGNTSAHYFVRSSDGQITQMIEHKNSAWHALCYNRRSIGIEHEGFTAQPAKYYTEAMYQESAKLTRWIADRHGIPRDRSRIIGHNQVPPSCNKNAHSDPGTGWNWTKYMALVNGTSPTPTTGKLTGLIYQGGSNTNRVAGATVTAGGKTVTTGAEGVYEFVLNPGTYTVTATKSGYTTSELSRPVAANTTTWGSMEINPSASTGVIKGKVYEYNPANPSDMSRTISGASVSAGGASKTSDATGYFEFQLPAGTYTVAVNKQGFATNSVSRQVTANGIIWGSVGLSSSTSADVQPPQLSITFPSDKSSTQVAAVTLSGTASDNASLLGKVRLKINDREPVEIPVAGNQFTQAIKLSPGANNLEVTATDAANNTGRATATVTFEAGISGLLHVTGDESKRIAGATVRLLNATTKAELSRTTSGADGTFGIQVSEVNREYILDISAPGFLTLSETIDIPDDERLNVKLVMTEGTDPRPSEVSLTFVDPQDGALVAGNTVVVYGTVEGFELATVTVNGAAAEQVGASGFSATVTLVEGENVIEAVAAGFRGESVSGRIKVTRTGAKTGCASIPGLELLAVGALLPLLRRRRAPRV